MKTPYTKPKTSGFDWHITEPSFSNSIDENPLYTPDINDPDTLIQNQIRIFEDEISAYAEDPLEPLAGQGAPVHIGIDCEYQHVDGTLTNTILSYQFCLYSSAGVLKGIVYPTPTNTNGRIDFNIFLGTIIHTAMKDELIDEWPKVAYVYAHFMRADITHFSEFWKRKNEFDGLRGTIASIKTPYESDYSSEKTRYIKPSPLILKDEHRHIRRTIVQFIDTLLLTPGTQGLDAAGELIGIPKFELPEGYVKSDMARLLKERPDDFVDYALRDAEIAVRYGLRMRQFVTQELGLRRLPPTIGSIATSYFFKLLENAHG